MIVGARRCGKTYRLYQGGCGGFRAGALSLTECFTSILRMTLAPVFEPSLLADVLDTFYALYPAARTEGAYIFFDEIREIPEDRVRFCGVSRYGESDRLCDGMTFF